MIKRNCLIHFLGNLMALDGSLNVIQNGQTKFCCLVYGKYTPLIENSYLVISGLLLFYKFNFQHLVCKYQGVVAGSCSRRYFFSVGDNMEIINLKSQMAEIRRKRDKSCNRFTILEPLLFIKS